ncbi:MAG: hypothetical protein LBF83_03830 [Spirochaetaceae bacterium]|jgi:hypothetical protein|nr:hypothetical protein [Spirochaetaceae bacterium]
MYIKYVLVLSGMLLLANSCFAEKPADFVLTGIGGESCPLLTRSSELSGVFSLSKTKSYDYWLDRYLRVPLNYSLEIDYSLHSLQEVPVQNAAVNGCQVVLKIDDDSGWLLPGDLNFLAIDKPGPGIRYVIPLRTARIKKISFEINGSKKSGLELRLNGLRLTERFYGFDTTGEAVLTSPFVSRGVGTDSQPLTSISPDRDYIIGGPRFLFIDGIKDSTLITAGGNTFQYIANKGGGGYQGLTVPAVFLASRSDVQISGGVETAVLKAAPLHNETPVPPIIADPGFILMYPQDEWRGKNFEVFCWESFPNILIFDTASYEQQDKLFKRIAFFAEKKGFKGRLARDEEIAELHGWNAHDYSAETLARFFGAAKKASFPLLDEELALREILVETNIIKVSGDGFTAGSGAVISVSRDSPDYLRLTFMAHEAFHGIFFIDADFREFCKQRWDNLDTDSKRFITSYFDFQQYDIGDSFLVVNEFMAHCLQQGVSASGKYFGETLANRMYEKSPWRRALLPPRDEDLGSWPGIAETFRREAAALSDYVSMRWGLAAGRVWRVRA